MLASDVATVIANAPVRFQSANPFFGRTYQAATDQNGRFAFTGALNDSGSSRAIAIDAFTLKADHPTLPALLQSPPADGAFAGGEHDDDSGRRVQQHRARCAAPCASTACTVTGASVVATSTIAGTNVDADDPIGVATAAICLR